MTELRVEFVGGPLDGEFREVSLAANCRLWHVEFEERHIYCYEPPRQAYVYMGIEPLDHD